MRALERLINHYQRQPDSPNNATGADGVKIAVLRKGCAGLELIWAAAHRRTFYVLTYAQNKQHCCILGYPIFVIDSMVYWY